MNLKRDKWNECDLDPNAADLTEETHSPKVDTKDVLHDDTSLRTSVLFMGQNREINASVCCWLLDTQQRKIVVLD